MRIWDQIPPSMMCDQHLLGEHRELHGLWSILVKHALDPDNKGIGYLYHPETQRWIGYERALARRHVDLVYEMEVRNMNHNSDLILPNRKGATGAFINSELTYPPELATINPHEFIQYIALYRKQQTKKGCRCKLGFDLYPDVVVTDKGSPNKKPRKS